METDGTDIFVTKLGALINASQNGQSDYGHKNNGAFKMRIAEINDDMSFTDASAANW